VNETNAFETIFTDYSYLLREKLKINANEEKEIGPSCTNV